MGDAKDRKVRPPDPPKSGDHLSDHDLERYLPGMVEEPELATTEEHILACARCAAQAEESGESIDAIRAAGAEGGVRTPTVARHTPSGTRKGAKPMPGEMKASTANGRVVQRTAGARVSKSKEQQT